MHIVVLQIKHHTVKKPNDAKIVQQNMFRLKLLVSHDAFFSGFCAGEFVLLMRGKAVS